MSSGYIITFCDGDYDNVIPTEDMVPRKIYRSLEEAMNALNQYTEKLEEFNPILYGEVYPFEKTTLKQEVEQKGRGIVGWLKEDGERISLCILKFQLFTK
jgi:hypothetical protein